MRAFPALLRVATVTIGVLAAVPASAVTQLELWHALSGPAGDHITQLAHRFNESQTEYRVVATFKGGHEETLKAGLDAQRAGRAPHMLHIEDADSDAVAQARAAFRPVYQVMQEAREPLSPKKYMEAVSERFSDEQGRLVSLPLNVATPVLFYNREAFIEAGLDPDDPPRTWMKLQEVALKLAESYECTYTTDRPTWVHIENLLALHNEPLSERTAGRNAQDRLVFNGRLVMKHVGLLMSWVKSRLFTYFGPGGQAEAKFIEGECAMFTSASSAYANIAQKSKFKFGVSPLPFHDEFPGAPFTTLVGGGSLWVMTGKKAPEYRGVARFFTYLSQPEVQAEWHQATGFLPVSPDAFDLTAKQGFYEKNPGVDVPVRQVHGKMLNRARKERVTPAAWLRGIGDQELEDVWAARKTPKEGVDNTVERGNKQLQLMSARRTPAANAAPSATKKR
jgi:sn-glycerol 3-phosphate transport system substrate-binding protein